MTTKPKAEAEDNVTAADDPADAERAKLFQEFAAKHAGADGTPSAEDDSREVEDDAGTGNGEGDDPKPDSAAPAAEAEEPAADDTAAKPDPTFTIWADAKPELKAAHDAALAKLSALEHSSSSDRGRIAAFQKQVDELSTKLNAAPKPSTDGKPAGAEETRALNDLLNDPEFVAGEKEYPEIYKPIRKTMEAMAKGFETRLETRLRAEVDPLRATAATAAARFQEEDMKDQGKELLRLSPDYLTTVATPGFYDKFGEWIHGMPEEIQTMAKNATAIENGQSFVRDAKKTAALFTMFRSQTGFGGGQQAPTNGRAKPAVGKSSTSTVSVRRQLQLDASTETPEGAPGVASSDAEGYQADWKRYADRAAKRQDAQGFV